MKLGVSSYSFAQLVNTGKMGQLDIIAKTKEMGFDVIEFSTFTLPEGQTPLSFAPRVKEECDRVGIEIASYTIAADFINGSSGDWKAEATRLQDELRVAQILGVKSMRHDATVGFGPDHKGPRGFDDTLDVLVKGCREVTTFAADLGIQTMVENHGLFCQDSERLEKLVNGVNHPNFGLLVDMGNFLCVDEDPAKAQGLLMPYAFHVHAKDFHVKPGTAPDPGDGWFRSRGGNYLRGSIIGHGDVPIPQCISIMKNAGYDGVLSIEFEGLEDPIKGLSIGLDNLRRFVAM
ncbi:MAG: sugar phosphate isomerase/epimerase [Phycisphaerae bacterium]|nr:sugar phosphate isomerase/epimerase [Phycisphaerae bacterium]